MRYGGPHVSFTGCSVCGIDPIEDCVCGERRALRARAHEALDRWLDDCQIAAEDANGRGRSGYIGRFGLRANAMDEELSLGIERTIAEDL